MLKRWRVREVERLLGEGASHRQVARSMGLSRRTVARIAQGKRPERFHRPLPEEEPEEEESPPRRCRRCGYLVHRPCQICRARAARRKSRLERRAVSEAEEELRLELRPQHQERYEPLLAEKRRHEPEPPEGALGRFLGLLGASRPAPAWPRRRCG